MDNKYLAHIASDGREQTLQEHLEGTAKLCSCFAAAFNAEDQGRLTGMLHDIGKYSDAFQFRLRGGPKVDHSSAGAVESIRINEVPAAFCIAGHHAGLPDGGSKGDLEGSTLMARYNRQKSIPAYDAWKHEVSLFRAQLPAYCKNGTDVLASAFFIRMLYSCLVDADFLDTERFMTGKERQAVAADFEALNQRLDRYVAPWWNPNGELNQKRCCILSNCLDMGTEPRGIFTLTVPTGGGKTVASLAFALRHAKAHDLTRVIYVIPYTSIIEQNAEVFRTILGDENILEHHSSVEYDALDELDPITVRKQQATENWDAPVVVTTAVQFFESLFGAKSSRCRKLHNIANSVVIFDEAQMMPVPFLRPCVYAISQLVANYGISAVLCTATQPALNPMFREFLPDYSITELCPDELFCDPVFKRVLFRKQSGSMNDDDISAMLMQHDQVLCIVNSRVAAQNIFRRMSGNGCFHLSTMMCPFHRKEVLRTIRERLQAGKICRVVSTSLIEAGVDVDFPVVYREETGLDSALQAAGRCNREGKRPLEESICTVFKRDGPTPKLFSIQVSAGKVAMDAYPEDIAGKAAVRLYFEELFDLRGKQSLDVKNILAQLKEDNFPFHTVAGLFRLIEDAETRIIYIPFPEASPYLERLRQGERSRELMRKLDRFSVGLYEKSYEQLLLSGVVKELDEQVALLSDLSFYNMQTGLPMQVEGLNAIYI